jgi:hypothetical protein
VLFVVDVEDCTMQIDGEAAEVGKPVTLQYGRHTLKLEASGYDTITKYLFINSEEATFYINFEEEQEEDEAEEEETDGDTQTQSSTGNGEESGSDTESNTETNSQSEVEEELLSDYLSTLTDMLGSL